MTTAVRAMNPVALLLGSVAYLYSTISNVAIFPNNSPVILDTNYGALSGLRSVSRSGRPFIEFRGIPYAKPPIGDLRFEPPERPDNWTGVRDATRYGSRCWQVEFITRRLRGNEDCLFLNVYTHRVVKESEINETLLYPVMVYIHGGFFMSGRSSTYRPKYFMDENVVFVTLNYRLASFGFMNTGDDVVTGNMGLKDQNMALQWVQENIVYFGGDPGSVTLVGESAGAVSTHLHMLSPMSAGLFHAAISQSGTALSPWGLIRNPGKQARQLGRRLRCPTKPTDDMIRCLKSKRARSIAWTHLSFLRDLLKGRFSTFGPTIEAVNGSSTFLAEDPRTLLEKGELANKVPWINGVNSEEGLIYLVGVLRDEKKLSRLNENWNSLAPTIFDFEDNEDRENISSKIRDYYLKNHLIGPASLTSATQMFSDRAFFQDSHEAAVLQSKLAPVYSYMYSYRGDFGLANLLLSMSGTLPEAIDFVVGNALRWISTRILRMEQTHYGVCHTDDLVMFFNLATIPREIVPGSPDYPFSRSLVKLWTSFASKGKPGKFLNIPWEPVEPKIAKNGSYSVRRMNLDEPAGMVDEPFLERLNFWKSLGLAYTNINTSDATEIE